MRWKDEGIIIATQKYGDKDLIVSILTQYHGKYTGFTHIKNMMRSTFQISNLLNIEWSSKLYSNLGFFNCKLIESSFHHVLQDRLKSITMISYCYILTKVLPENEPYLSIYESFLFFIEIIKQNDKNWHSHYLNLELILLKELGFQLDLSRCAVTGITENLSFISPKTGRAISQKAGEFYSDKLLPFPKILYDIYNNNIKCYYSYYEFWLGLKVTGYFLNKYLFIPLNIKFPEIRNMILPE
ncbi:DNA repair protein RecO [Wolbachia endosymbiont of Howardula sp.]|uniref:DNA repair protein RecO n=1 Tax=Wolbachia endosymbiont of Howardula sp. TaxID=2916816 RepID=UPI00217F08AD|nr:DNA repair protein RecO [Wolbachia endosymbiont of Howardula sp.]UWI83066.1 DNA repair protein RecO [Wolbachia endosymbiont of Howardula sp.]